MSYRRGSAASNYPRGALGVRVDFISILRIARGDKIAETRVSIREDKANAAVLDATSDWMAAGKLKTPVVQKSKQSKPTVERRIASLVDQGVPEKRVAEETSRTGRQGLCRGFDGNERCRQGRASRETRRQSPATES